MSEETVVYKPTIKGPYTLNDKSMYDPFESDEDEEEDE